MYLFVHVCQQSGICDNGIWYLQVQVQVQPLLSPTHCFLMSLFRKLHTSRTSTSSNADLISTPATVRSTTQSGSVLHHHRDSNDFDYGLDDVITRPAGTFPITPRTKKQLKSSCDDIAHHHDVDADDLKRFAEVHSTLFELCHLFTSLVPDHPSHASWFEGTHPQSREGAQKKTSWWSSWHAGIQGMCAISRTCNCF